MNSKNVCLYDTTLRDGSQGLGVSFSVADKIRIAQKLDSLGIQYIEGGWPGSNPKDIEFFSEIKKFKFNQARMAAFGSTRRANIPVEKDAQVLKLLEVETPVVTIFGKSWSFHVTDILKVSFEENLAMIADTVRYLKSKGREVVYDAEHFFDGFKADPEYAVKTLKAAEDAGADYLTLCDTNGGTLPSEISQVISHVKKHVSAPLGIHAHNDSGVAVANSLLAVTLGIRQVQGTINGLGERTGNADLCTILPNLQLKMGFKVVSDSQLRGLIEVSRFVDDLANMRHNPRLPFVGETAFAHKGGIHVDAVQKNQKSYEHIDPVVIGAKRIILVSELSGQSNVLMKAKDFGFDLKKNDPVTREIVKCVKEKEHKGYEYEPAEASLEVLIRKMLGKHQSFFEVLSYRVIVEHRDGSLLTEATVKVSVNGEVIYLASEGDGPVNALDSALRKSLQTFYPVLSEVELADFKVRVLEGEKGTSAHVRVLIESRDKQSIWGNVGVSENIIEACMEALVDSIEYKLYKSAHEGN